jgi:hypothetical protein
MAARRKNTKLRRKSTKPSLHEIRDKLAEADFFLQKLRHHKKLQRRPEKPPADEFRYYLSAFLTAARSVTDLMPRIGQDIRPKLNNAEKKLHELYCNLRNASVHDGRIETTPGTKRVVLPPDPGLSSMFGDVFTYAETHSVELNGKACEVVEVSQEYFDLLKREVDKLTPPPAGP